MLKTISKFILSVAAITALTSSVALADQVNLSLGDTEGTFYCEVNSINPLKSVDIDTDGVEVKGFCKGQSYVEREGHVKGFPFYKLKKVYFEYKKSATRDGSVNITASDPSDISCKEGKGENRKAYGQGGYC